LRVVILPIVEELMGWAIEEHRFAEVLEMVVRDVGWAPLMPAKDASGVGVDHETSMCAGIEEHAVGGFGTDARNGKQSGAGLGATAREEAIETGTVFVDQHAEEGAKPASLDIEVTGRPEQAGKIGFGKRQEELRFEGTG
jgi:hypothetical protein